MEIHLHPHLTRMWAPLGQQPQVSAPGKNQKTIVYGGVNYRTGKLTYTVADTKCGAQFLVFLTTLLAGYVGKRLKVVCDNGRFHTTKAVRDFLRQHRQEMTVIWLPPYCPSLNLIERLWGHLKRTILANVLFESLADLVQAFRRGIRRLDCRPERMAFLYHEPKSKSVNPRRFLRRVA
jgi:transposase